MKKFLAAAVLILQFYSCCVSAQSEKQITAILGAFPAEVSLIHDRIQNPKEMIIQQIPFTEGTLNGRHIVLAQTGIGKVNAAITTTLMLEHFKPSEVIFTGIAGGVNPALSPGDLVIGYKVGYHDYGAITPDSMVRKPTKSQDNRVNNPLYFLSDETLVKIAQQTGKEVKLQHIGTASDHTPQVITGIIVTGDVFVSSTAVTKQLRLKMNADATEMEGAAVAQTCYQQQTPFLVIRSLSDNADNNAHDDVEAFYKVAAYNSAALVMAIVAKLID